MNFLGRYLGSSVGWLIGIFSAALVVLVAAPAVYADIGVSISPGKVQVDETLRPGGIYQLPPLSVSNTGTERATYNVGVAYHQHQSEFRPPADWLEFKPSEFELEPGEGRDVQVELALPLQVRPGDYFVFLEAGPQQRATQEQASVGVAAATKLRFSVEPANIWWGLYYKALALWQEFTPWVQIGLGIISGGLILLLLKRRFSVNIQRRSD